MTVALTSHDVQLVDAALRTLLTPLEHGSVDAWRAAVLHDARELLDADTGSFLLEGGPSIPVYSDGVSQDVVDAYRQYYHRHDHGLAVRRREIGAEVWTTDMLWERPALEASEYWNDYKVPNRLYHALGVTLEATPDRPATALHFHHDTPGVEFGARERELLRLIAPALRVGVDLICRSADARRRSANLLDAIHEGAAVFDFACRRLHQNQSLGRMLAADPEQETLARAVTRLAVGLTESPLSPAPVTPSPSAEVRTAGARYRLSASVLPEGTCGAGRSVLVTVLRAGPEPLCATRVAERFGLTRREADVALRLVEGKSNAEIATALEISTHTARHHTESVLVKLGVKSRAQVGAAVRAAV